MGEEELGGQNLGLILKQNKRVNRKHYIAETRGIHSNWEEGGNLLLPLKVAGALASSSQSLLGRAECIACAGGRLGREGNQVKMGN